MEAARGHLAAGEQVDAVVAGTYVTKSGGAGRNGLLLATDRRLVFFALKLGGHEMESFPWSQLSSFEAGKGMLGHWYRFAAAGNKLEVKWIKDGDAAGHVAELVRSRVGQSAAAPAPAAGVADPAASLRQLQELHQQGLITEAEFGAKRAEILARM